MFESANDLTVILNLKLFKFFFNIFPLLKAFGLAPQRAKTRLNFRDQCSGLLEIAFSLLELAQGSFALLIVRRDAGRFFHQFLDRARTAQNQLVDHTLANHPVRGIAKARFEQQLFDIE